MSLFEWDKTYELGIREIDQQHKHLVSVLNELHKAMKAGNSNEKLNKIIHELIRYTQTHFSTEEKYFDLYKYPDTLAHKLEHSQFVEKVANFQTDFEMGKVTISMQIMTFLKSWLTNHIKGKDKLYAPFLKQKGLV